MQKLLVTPCSLLIMPRTMHFHYPLQKLYMEVRRAVRQLYVKSSAPGSNGREWYHALDGGVRREPASQDSLPGPCGGQSLHLHPKQAQDDALEPHLPKARFRCICQEGLLYGGHASREGDTCMRTEEILITRHRLCAKMHADSHDHLAGGSQCCLNGVRLQEEAEYVRTGEKLGCLARGCLERAL